MSAEKIFPTHEIARCPYAFYQRAREEPIFQSQRNGEFIGTKFEDVTKVLSNAQLFSSASILMQNGEHRACTVDEARSATIGPFVAMDAPEHTARRNVARQILKPDDIKSLEPLVARVIDELIDGLIAKGSCEFIADFALRLPACVVLNMLGMPLEDEARAIKWSQYDGRGTRFHPKERRDGIKDTLLDVADYMRAAVLDRYENPRDDGLGRYVRAHIESEGSFNLTNAIADASLLLFGGVKISAGSILLILIGAANRDDREFAKPDDIDPTRRGPGHIAFGYGSHVCIGAPLARAEGKLAFEKLFSRLPMLRYAEGNDFAPISDTMLFRGQEKLYLRFD